MNSRIRIIKGRHLVLLAVCAGLIGGVSAVRAGPGPTLRGFVIANGGTRSTATNLVSYGTIGQAIVGSGTGANLRVFQGFWTNAGSPLVGLDPPTTGLPVELSIGPAFPNPGRNAVRFTMTLPRAARVKVEVFDVAGRVVGEAVEREFEAGSRQLTWDAPARATGVFFARLSVNGRIAAEREFVLAR